MYQPQFVLCLVMCKVYRYLDHIYCTVFHLICEVRVGPCFEEGLGSSDISPLHREEQSRPVSGL